MTDFSYSYSARRATLQWHSRGVQRLLFIQIVGVLAINVSQLMGNHDDIVATATTATCTAKMANVDFASFFPVIHLFSYLVGYVVYQCDKSSYFLLSFVMTVNAVSLYASVTIVINDLVKFFPGNGRKDMIPVELASWVIEFVWKSILTLITASLVVISIADMHGYRRRPMTPTPNNLNNATKPNNAPAAAATPIRTPTFDVNGVIV